MNGGRFERVYTVTDYWDGPREGVADFGGVPHLYRSVWRRGADDWDNDRYFLSPLTPDQASLLREDWAIWQRFANHYRGRVVPAGQSFDQWGALPEDLSRRRELRRLLAPILALHHSRCFIARAEFRPLGPPPGPGPIVPTLEVCWTESAAEADDELLPSPPP
jgi:hypothetical protein